MPRGGPLIMENFILPALDAGKYGDTLKWVDKAKGLFMLSLVHKKKALWTENDVLVFIDWDQMKNRDPSSNSYLTESKQRFKNALRKCQSITDAPKGLLRRLGIEKDKNHLFYVYNKTAKKTTKGKKSQHSSASKNNNGEVLHLYEFHSLCTPPPSPEGDGHLEAYNSQPTFEDYKINWEFANTFQENQIVPSPSEDISEDYNYDNNDGVLVKNKDVMFGQFQSNVIKEENIQMYDWTDELELSELLQ